MKTDVITVSSEGTRVESALKQAEKVAAYKEMSPKGALHLRLLTEEMMGLMRSMTGAREGLFWIEDENGVYSLHLQVNSRLSEEKREKLLAVATSGKNESARGLMGRLRDFFDWSSDEDVAAYSGPLVMHDMFAQSSSPMLDWEWSMTRYESALYSRVEKGDAAAKIAWDELEKSVVRHVADDIKVSIRSGIVEMTILKKLA